MVQEEMEVDHNENSEASPLVRNEEMEVADDVLDINGNDDVHDVFSDEEIHETEINISGVKTLYLDKYNEYLETINDKEVVLSFDEIALQLNVKYNEEYDMI